MPQHAVVRGKATRTEAGSSDILAAPGASSQYSLKTLIVTIHTTDVAGKVIIDDGTTQFMGWAATTDLEGQPPCINIPDGYHWEANKAIRLTTEGAVEAFAMAVAEVRGQS